MFNKALDFNVQDVPSAHSSTAFVEGAIDFRRFAVLSEADVITKMKITRYGIHRGLDNHLHWILLLLLLATGDREHVSGVEQCSQTMGNLVSLWFETNDCHPRELKHLGGLSSGGTTANPRPTAVTRQEQ